MIYYNALHNSFYDDVFDNDIPIDSIEIGNIKHRELLNGMSDGYIVAPDDDGNPVLVQPSN